MIVQVDVNAPSEPYRTKPTTLTMRARSVLEAIETHSVHKKQTRDAVLREIERQGLYELTFAEAVEFEESQPRDAPVHWSRRRFRSYYDDVCDSLLERITLAHRLQGQRLWAARFFFLALILSAIAACLELLNTYLYGG
jgi:hypothetical protein